MKKGILACVIASFVVGNPLSFSLRGYTNFQQSVIKGKISPADGSEVVWAVTSKDSSKTAVVFGNFSLYVKPGVYKLIVNAKAPYKNVSLGNLEVQQNRVLNIGEIMLQK